MGILMKEKIDIAGIIGIVTIGAGLVAGTFATFGEQAAADAVNLCLNKVNNLGPDVVAVCKDAAVQSKAASKTILSNALVALGGIFGFRSKMFTRR